MKIMNVRFTAPLRVIALALVMLILLPIQSTASEKESSNSSQGFEGASCHECWFINGQDHCVYTRSDTRCMLFFEASTGFFFDL